MDLLRNEVILAIKNMFNGNTQNIWFQQDRPYFAIVVRQFLNNIFSNGWIERCDQIEWPPRSQDLSPLDCFLWRYLKNSVYATKPADIANLRERIVHQIGLISADMKQNVLDNFYLHYQIIEEGQFEYFIK